MKYLLDTDWVADYLGGRMAALTLLPTLADDGLAISLITYGEIYEGVYFGRDPEAAERIFRLFLRGVTVSPLQRRIMRRFAPIRGQLRRGGQIIGDPDILIAAAALQHDLTLVTRNVADFRRIPDLRLYRPG